jgi:hypothetical protein
MKRGTKHSTERDDGSQGVGKSGFKYKKAPASEGGRYNGMRGHLKVAVTRTCLVWCGGACGYWG